MAAEFYAPQFIPPPDMLAAYVRGQMAPGAIQGQQQELTEGRLRIDQLRLALQKQGIINQAALGQMGGGSPQQPGPLAAGAQMAGDGQPSGPVGAGAQNLSGPTGGIQNGPQGALAAPTQPLGISSGSFFPSDGSLRALGMVAPEAVKGMMEGQDAAIKLRELQLAGPMDLAKTVAGSADAHKLVWNNASLQPIWKQYAPVLGLDPNDPSALTPDNARKAAVLAYNTMAASVKGATLTMPQHYTDVIGPNGAFGQREDLTNKLTMDSRAPMLDEYRFAQSQGYRVRFTDFMQLRQQNAENKPPSGYTWNPDGTLKVIPGGPADKGGLDSRSGLMFQRVLSSANEATAALKNIAELPVGASTGVFGVGASPGHSVLASAKGALTNKLAPQDVQDYNVMIAGLSRNLSTIESAGLAPNGSLTGSMDAVQLRSGDTELTKLRKLAEARQILEKGLETNLDNPKLPQQQRDAVTRIISDVQASIPFTHHDLTALQKAQQSNPSTTLQDLIQQKSLGSSSLNVGQSQRVGGFTVKRVK